MFNLFIGFIFGMVFMDFLFFKKYKNLDGFAAYKEYLIMIYEGIMKVIKKIKGRQWK